MSRFHKSIHSMFFNISILFFALLLSSCGQQQENLNIDGSGTSSISSDVHESSNDLEFARPEDVGMDKKRLDRVTTAMQDLVDQGLLSGVVTMVARENKIVHLETVGFRDIESQAPMMTDSLFRIYSMTKPITGVALMTLYEEGKFKLSDPVGKYIPQFENLKVAAGVDADGNIITEEPTHKMTIRELMTHTGGLSYGLFSQSKVDDMYGDLGLLDVDNTLEEAIHILSKIPLRQQPGSMWHYSVSVDVQGYLVEVLSGKSFDKYLEERIFKPLCMNDTAFYVPPEKANRFAQVYDYSDEGDLIVAEGGIAAMQDFLKYPNLISGGGGLVSSAMDYMRFSQMLLNGGELDGVRILAPLTVDLMHRNQLPEGMKTMGPGTGFGLDFAVIIDPVEADTYSQGEFTWGGAAGTWFWIDPVENLVFVGMMQQFGNLRPDVGPLTRQLTYQSIMDPNIE